MITPPSRSNGLLSDVSLFLLHKPNIPTLIKFKTEVEREDYSQRIMQRLGIDVSMYSVLNIHKIGIKVPVRYAFEEILQWDGDSTCWPNHIAAVERMDGELEHIQIHLLGRKKYPLGFKNAFFGLKFIPLFSLNVMKFQHSPGPSDDNARFLLYESSGGYPIGIFTMYVRSSIAERGEIEQAQLFLAVGFNFYGKENQSSTGIVNKSWEKIHNRVTANTLNRFKQLCEWRFQRIQEGRYNEDPKRHG
jgi:hypothetical protein